MQLQEVLTNRVQGLRADLKRKDSGEQLLTHIPTGFNVIDATYGGIRRGVATELLAHTGDGKSAFARGICNGAASAGAGVLWFCGEDPEDATAERYLADEGSISATELGRLDISKAQIDRLDKFATKQEWAKRVEVIFESPSVEEVLSIVADTVTVGGAPLLLCVFDYAQIFGDSANLEAEIAKLATGINQMSGGRRMASLILSQVSNDVYKRGREQWLSRRDITGFTPGLGDTEWCKRAEKSCKAVWSLFRPGRWLRDMGQEAEDDTAELHVKKASFGPQGFEILGWDGPGVRFYNR